MGEPRPRWTEPLPPFLLYWLPARRARKGNPAAVELVPGLWALGRLVHDDPDRLLHRWLRRDRVPRWAGEGVRLFVDRATGWRYHVRLAPMERRGALGVDWRLNAIVFETEDGKWVGSAPLYHNVTLESLSGAAAVPD